jgi:hypothetical protein
MEIPYWEWGVRDIPTGKKGDFVEGMLHLGFLDHSYLVE